MGEVSRAREPTIEEIQLPNVTVAAGVRHRAEIIERLAMGERLSDVAASLGVAASSVSAAMNQDPEYQAALRLGAEHHMNRREAELEQASDGLTIQRSRELLAHARWRLERLHPAMWGLMPRTAIQVDSNGPAVIRIVNYADAADA